MGRSRSGLTTGIHALVDADGVRSGSYSPLGQAHDAPIAEALLEHIGEGATLIADRAYDTNAIHTLAAERGAWANIPPPAIRKGTFSFLGYRQRNLVERFFNRIKRFRGLATATTGDPRTTSPQSSSLLIRIWLAAI
jgi:transposase